MVDGNGNGNRLPSWFLPQINIGQIVYTMAFIGMATWMVSQYFNDRDDKNARQTADLRHQIEVLTTRTALLEVQLSTSIEWRNEVRGELRSLNTEAKATNETLTAIRLSLANKVDRKP